MSQNSISIKEKSGSCAIVILMIEDMVYIANVGDSRAVMSM
jgi:protein phosphatase 2C family protein 2/3